MLTVTDNAATAIRDITAQEALPPGAGLRIFADATDGALILGIATEPSDGDQVLNTAGALLFLDRAAAKLLDDKELDVTINHDGEVQFAVGDKFDYGVSEDL